MSIISLSLSHKPIHYLIISTQLISLPGFFQPHSFMKQHTYWLQYYLMLLVVLKHWHPTRISACQIHHLRHAHGLWHRPMLLHNLYGCVMWTYSSLHMHPKPSLSYQKRLIILFEKEKQNLKMNTHCTNKFFIKVFFSKCEQIRRKMGIWPHLLKKSLLESFIFCTVTYLLNV